MDDALLNLAQVALGDDLGSGELPFDPDQHYADRLPRARSSAGAGGIRTNRMSAPAARSPSAVAGATGLPSFSTPSIPVDVRSSAPATSPRASVAPAFNRSSAPGMAISPRATSIGQSRSSAPMLPLATSPRSAATRSATAAIGQDWRSASPARDIPLSQPRGAIASGFPSFAAPPPVPATSIRPAAASAGATAARSSTGGGGGGGSFSASTAPRRASAGTGAARSTSTTQTRAPAAASVTAPATAISFRPTRVAAPSFLSPTQSAILFMVGQSESRPASSSTSSATASSSSTSHPTSLFAASTARRSAPSGATSGAASSASQIRPTTGSGRGGGGGGGGSRGGGSGGGSFDSRDDWAGEEL